MTLHNMVEAEQRYTQHMLNPTLHCWVDPRIDYLGRLRCSDSTSVMDAATSFRKGPSLIAEMVGGGMLKTLHQLGRRRFGDEDISVLVQELSATLESSMETLTSFSECCGEVMSTVLEWTPVHTSTKFWKENAIHFEENNYAVLEALGRIILETPHDTTLAVTCHDLGEVVRYHPTGRNLLTLPSMAGVVMELMSASQAEVAKEALLCTQKIMVQRWEYIQQER